MSDSDGGSGGSFEERLRAARGRQGLDAPPATETGDSGRSESSSMASAWRIGLRVGVELVSAVVVAVAIGWGLDRLFGTSPAFALLFMLLGGAAGVLNVWRMFAKQDGRGG